MLRGLGAAAAGAALAAVINNSGYSKKAGYASLFTVVCAGGAGYYHWRTVGREWWTQQRQKNIERVAASIEHNEFGPQRSSLDLQDEFLPAPSEFSFVRLEQLIRSKDCIGVLGPSNIGKREMLKAIAKRTKLPVIFLEKVDPRSADVERCVLERLKRGPATKLLSGSDGFFDVDVLIEGLKKSASDSKLVVAVELNPGSHQSEEALPNFVAKASKFAREIGATVVFSSADVASAMSIPRDEKTCMVILPEVPRETSLRYAQRHLWVMGLKAKEDSIEEAVDALYQRTFSSLQNELPDLVVDRKLREKCVASLEKSVHHRIASLCRDSSKLRATLLHHSTEKATTAEVDQICGAGASAALISNNVLSYVATDMFALETKNEPLVSWYSDAVKRAAAATIA